MKLPQLSLRDLFWLVALTAMGIALTLSTIRNYQLHERVQVLEKDYRRCVLEYRAFERYIRKPFNIVPDDEGNLEVHIYD
jgi:hypothetical protein